MPRPPDTAGPLQAFDLKPAVHAAVDAAVQRARDRSAGPGQIAYEAYRDAASAPGRRLERRLRADIEHFADVEDLADRQPELDAVRRRLVAAGFDPDDRAVEAEVHEAIDRAEDEVERAERYNSQVSHQQTAEHYGWEDVGVTHCDLSDPVYREAWDEVFGPSTCSGRIRAIARMHQHGARHRRAGGGRPVHRRGSRRCTRAGPDDSDGDSEPPRLGSWRRRSRFSSVGGGA